MAAPPPVSLRERVLRATSWTIAGYMAAQVLRFLSNIVLTRLLFPEAFGTMALMFAVLIGVNMLTDLGLTQGIIRNAKGTDPAYLRTAFTLQVLKGIVVGIVMLLVAHPVALHYERPEMEGLMGGVALVALISSLSSTKLAVLQRNIDARRMVFIELSTQGLQILVTTLLAWWHPSVWALIWGNVAGAAAKSAASHWMLEGTSDRLGWDKEAAKGVFSLSGWMLISSAVTFLSGEGLRLLSGSLLDIRLVGLVGLAGSLNGIIWQLIQTLSGRVLFPAYSEVARTNDMERMSRVVEKSRFMQIAPAWLAALGFVVGGPTIIHLLYDARYADAGLILQISAAGFMVGVLTGSYAGVLWALGKVGLSTALIAAQVLMQWVCMLVGHHFGGQLGVLLGSAAASWLLYPVTAITFARYRLWHPRIDIPVLLASASVWVGMFFLIDWSHARAW